MPAVERLRLHPAFLNRSPWMATADSGADVGNEAPRDTLSELGVPGPYTIYLGQAQCRISIRNSERQRMGAKKGARLVVYTLTPQKS